MKGRIRNRVASEICASALQPDTGTPLHDERVVTARERVTFAPFVLSLHARAHMQFGGSPISILSSAVTLETSC